MTTRTWTHPFWTTPLAEADARFEGVLTVGEVPDPDVLRAAGWTISEDGSTILAPDDDGSPIEP